MTILYLHGFCANLRGKKASFLRSHFGDSAVIEPPEPGLAYCKSLTQPLLQRLGDQFKKKPGQLLGLLGPGRTRMMRELAPQFVDFFSRSVASAQAVYDQLRPDVIVGSSMGGGVAMALKSDETPMVLIGPVWHPRVSSAISIDNLPGVRLPTKVLLSLATAAMRGPIATFAGFKVPPVIKPQTIILHSAHDRLFDVSNSRMLLQSCRIKPKDPVGAQMLRVVAGLNAAGYANQISARKGNFNDGRLIVIGKDHHTNEPDPYDTANKNPHPHDAMVKAVELLHAELNLHRYTGNRSSG